MPSSKVVVLVVLVAVIVVGAASYVVFLSSPSVQPSTTSTLSTPANLVVSVGHLPADYCSLATYSNSSLSINWGNLAPGTEGIQYICVENTGTTPMTLTVSSTLPSSIGRVTSPQVGTKLNGKGIDMIELDVRLQPSVSLGPIQSFTITLGGSS